MRRRSTLLEVVLASLIALLLSAFAVQACGGAASPGASTPSSSGAGTAGERCLATADAKRQRKPSEPAHIVAKHVLVRYAGANRAPATVTRTREQACLRAAEALSKMKAGLSFTDAVAQYSDEEGGPRHDGSIGTVSRSDVAAPFADAAFELESGEVSEVVETPFGFHVIMRVE